MTAIVPPIEPVTAAPSARQLSWFQPFDAGEAACGLAVWKCDSRCGLKLATIASGARAASMWMMFAIGLSLTSSAHAEVPASYWTTKSMSVPVPMCVHAAGKAVQETGLSNITKSEAATGGYTATTRGYIVCVCLPKAGACNGDGTTAVIVTAWSDAKNFLNKIADHLKAPTIIDCGPEGNPVNN
jgi:hypothetical protein